MPIQTLIFTVILAFASSGIAQIEADRTLKDFFAGQSLEPIPSQILDTAFATIELEMANRISYLTAEERHSASKYLSQVYPLVQGTFQRLKTKNRFFYLTPELRKTLGVNEVLCEPSSNPHCPKTPGTCKKLNGFYIPTLDWVFIEKTLTGNDFFRSLTHEVIHAFQYAFRFPLDWIKLKDLQQQGKLNEATLRNYLYYFYENTDSFQAMALFRIENWQQQRKRKTAIRQLFQLPVTAIDFSSQALTVGAYKGPGVGRFASLLPLSDKGTDWLSYKGTGRDTAFLFSEPLLLRRGFYLGVDMDLAFHRKYTDALSCAYEENKGTQEIDKELHDFFATEFLTPFSSAQLNPKVLDDVLKSDVSPFISWLTLPVEAFGDSGPFARFINVRADVIKLYETNPLSPFKLKIPLGSEGGHGDLDFQPQIEVEPNEK